MRAHLCEGVVGVVALAGSAEEIPLGNSSADGVVAGQAAHWFDMRRAAPEMARVLRPGGSLGLIWNRMDPATPWVAALVAVLREVNVRRIGHGADLSVLHQGRFRRPVRRTWRFLQTLDRCALIDLVASRSYVMGLVDNDRKEVLDRVASIAPSQHRFDLPYKCEVWRTFRHR
jgi:SAM-dependent methyltransferase